MIVKHKAGRFRTRWITIIREHLFCHLARLFSGKAKVRIKFNHLSCYTSDEGGKGDWLKVFGCKTFGSTETRKEVIVAYRYYWPNTYFETCIYYRTGDGKHYQKDVRQLQFDQATTYEIKLPYFLPVSSWAGGSEKPENDFEYQLWLK